MPISTMANMSATRRNGCSACVTYSMTSLVKGQIIKISSLGFHAHTKMTGWLKPSKPVLDIRLQVYSSLMHVKCRSAFANYSLVISTLNLGMCLGFSAYISNCCEHEISKIQLIIKRLFLRSLSDHVWITTFTLGGFKFNEMRPSTP